jgi:tetratricopeptide (TPR) repeat protein
MFKKISLILLSFIIIATFIFSGCTKPEGIAQESPFDTPERHYELGKRALENNNLDEAEREFKRALDLAVGMDKEFAPGHEGLGLVFLHRGNLEAAEKAFNKAKSIDGDYGLAYVGLGRVKAAEGEYEDAVKLFDKALDKDPDTKEAPFYKGEAYEKWGKFDEAEDAYREALKIDPTYTKATDEWKRLQEENRASAGMGEAYRKVAREKEIDRADLAVLLNDLPLERIYRQGPKTETTKFQSPESVMGKREEATTAETSPADIQGHWAEPYIKEALKYGVMEVYPDGNFNPEEKITRANYAMIIQSLLAKALNDPKLTTRFIGNSSPFPDVMASHYAFNAVMVATTRGIMEANLDGTFGLTDTVSGAEAINILKKLKKQLE